MTTGEQLIKPNMYLQSQGPNGLNKLTKRAIKSFKIAVKSQSSPGKYLLLTVRYYLKEPESFINMNMTIDITTNPRLFLTVCICNVCGEHFTKAVMSKDWIDDM